MRHSHFMVPVMALLIGGGHAVGGGFVLVTEREGTMVAKISTTTDQIIGRATIGNVPSEMAVDRLRRWVYVSAHLDHKLVVLNADTLAAADVVIPGLGKLPIGVAITPDYRRVLVTTRGTDGVISSDDRLDVVELDTSAWPPTGSLVSSIPTGLHPIKVCIDHDGRYAVVAVRNEPAILIVDLQTYAIVGQAENLPSDAEPEGCDAHPSDPLIYVTLHGPISTIEVVDLVTLSVSRHVPIVHTPPARPSMGVFTPDGTRFYVSGQTVNKVFLFETSDPYNPVQNMSVQLPVGQQPHDIVYLPDGRAYVANTNNQQPFGSLAVIHNYMASPTSSGPILTGLAGPLNFANFAWNALGDLNCDGVVNFDDINPFVVALSDPAAYQAAYPSCNIMNGDCNGDGFVDFDDINPFVALLSG
jgi:DNA-binding beta-propeller fold protein YncE